MSMPRRRFHVSYQLYARTVGQFVYYYGFVRITELLFGTPIDEHDESSGRQLKGTDFKFAKKTGVMKMGVTAVRRLMKRLQGHSVLVVLTSLSEV